MEALRIADYCAIYPLISGSFTPMCLVYFHDSTVGWTFFGVVWALSISGMVLTITQVSGGTATLNAELNACT